MGENSSFPPLIATEENKRDANLRSEHERRAHCKWRGKFTRFEANMSARPIAAAIGLRVENSEAVPGAAPRAQCQLSITRGGRKWQTRAAVMRCDQPYC